MSDTPEAAEKAEAESVMRGKMLQRIHGHLVNVRDTLDDQGDLVAFGSTNDADRFRDAVQELDDFNWSAILAEKDEPDWMVMCREATARAEKAEAERDAAYAEIRRTAEQLRQWAQDEVEGDDGVSTVSGVLRSAANLIERALKVKKEDG